MTDSVWLAWALSPVGALMGFFKPTARLFHWYVASGLMIAFLWYWMSGRLAEFRQATFSRKVWLSRSAVNDYFVLFLNPWFIFPLIFFSQEQVREFFSHLPAALTHLGLAPRAPDPGPLAVASVALTLCLFIADDFARWASHYLSHRVPVLWEFHKVHHSAEVLNFVTAERSHPVDVYLTTMTLLATATFVNGIFIIFFGEHLTAASMAGANVILVTFNLGGAVLRHSPYWISYGSATEHWLISPAMHHIHHSSMPEHWDRNFGSFLAIWDRWFGTLHIPRGREPITFGIGSETSEYRSIANLYLLPFRKIGLWCNTSVLNSRSQPRS